MKSVCDEECVGLMCDGVCVMDSVCCECAES